MKSALSVAAAVLFVVSSSALVSHAESPDASSASNVHDIVIAGGRVIDPETGFDAVANVGITGGTITAVSTSPLNGHKTIDAHGQVVAPGFIDLHAHGQSKVADRMQAFDGVTTALELESGTLPVGAWYDAQAKAGRVLNYGTSAAWTFARIAELEELQPEADVLWFQKAFSLQKWVNNAATRVQVGHIVDSLEQGLRDGAIGIGINAGYAPGGGYKELLAVHKLAASYGVPTFTHISGDFPDDPKSAAESVGDIISLTVATGSQSHICHINSSSLSDIDTTMSMIAAARARKLPITTESYTYGASSTTVGAALFSDEAREKKSIDTSSIEFNGQPLDDASFAKLRSEEPGSVVVFHFLKLPQEQATLDKAVLGEGVAIASDAMPWADKRTGQLIGNDVWPLPDYAFAHPRSAGTYTRLLSYWVREQKTLSLVEAVQKASLIPAQILEASVPQMAKKGRLQVGMDADVIVFDPVTVRDRATFTQPNQTAEGMQHVFVNGVPVIRQGQLDMEAAPGKAVRRTPTNSE